MMREYILDLRDGFGVTLRVDPKRRLAGLANYNDGWDSLLKSGRISGNVRASYAIRWYKLSKLTTLAAPDYRCSGSMSMAQ